MYRGAEILHNFLFEQRLFASISAVSKGVLKEHLILVASCMSCTGNLSGFNDSGYKALLHSLKVQVPFTEATIFVRIFYSLDRWYTAKFLIHFFDCECVLCYTFHFFLGTEMYITVLFCRGEL